VAELPDDPALPTPEQLMLPLSSHFLPDAYAAEALLV
jgi:hypothetical protein